MPYDIYGQPLRPGYCEVHPSVRERYPCSHCQDDYYDRHRYDGPEPPEPEWEMPDEEICEAQGHPEHGSDDQGPRCYCGAVRYPYRKEVVVDE